MGNNRLDGLDSAQSVATPNNQNDGDHQTGPQSPSPSSWTVPLNHPSRYRPPSCQFQCGETIDRSGEVGVVSFHCTLPNYDSNTIDRPNQCRRLEFSCRGRSVGCLVEGEGAVRDEDLEATYEHVDPCFFDAGYSLAGRTGFQVWAGSRLLLESLSCVNHEKKKDRNSMEDRLNDWQTRVRQGARIIELGSGVGLVGATLASMGGQVLLTDLPTLVDSAIWPNLELNRNDDPDKDDTPPPDWLLQNTEDEPMQLVAIGDGWAATAALDWTKPVEDQLASSCYNNVDLIVASDCVWLASMLQSLLDTVQSIFDVAIDHCRPTFLMSFQRRDSPQKDKDSIFTTVDRVVEAMNLRGWKVQCLAWNWARVDVDGDEDDGGEERKANQEVFLFEIVPSRRDDLSET